MRTRPIQIRRRQGTIPASVETHEVKHTDDRLDDLQQHRKIRTIHGSNDLLQCGKTKALSGQSANDWNEACGKR
jgi:hypothetical protein